MPRLRLEAADIFRAHGPAYRREHAGHLNLPQLKVMSAIETCGTAALGGHVTACLKCDHQHIAYGRNPVVAVIDSTQAGKLVRDLCALDSDVPIVATLADTQAMCAQVLVLGTALSGGRLPQDRVAVLEKAIAAGMSLINRCMTACSPCLWATCALANGSGICACHRATLPPSAWRAQLRWTTCAC